MAKYNYHERVTELADQILAKYPEAKANIYDRNGGFFLSVPIWGIKRTSDSKTLVENIF